MGVGYLTNNGIRGPYICTQDGIIVFIFYDLLNLLLWIPARTGSLGKRGRGECKSAQDRKCII